MCLVHFSRILFKREDERKKNVDDCFSKVNSFSLKFENFERERITLSRTLALRDS